MAGKWKMIRLGDVCDILDSQRIPITSSERISGPYPYYGANGIQDYVNDYIFDDELVLLAEDGGNFGETNKPIAYRVSGKCWVNNHAHVLKPKETLNVDYLCYSIMFYDVSKLINGTTRKKLNQASVRIMQIPLPPLDEQKRIADVLDKASELINKRKEQIRLMDQLPKSLFIEMFGDPVENPRGWEQRLFVDLFSVIYRYPTFYGLEYVPNGVPVVRIGNISENGDILYSSQKYVQITRENNAKYPRTQLQLFDILMAVRGDGSTAKRIGVIKDSRLISANISANLILLRENKSIAHYSYLFNMLTSKAGQQILDKYVTKTAKKTITSKDLKRIMFPLPPLSLQNEFADRIAVIEKQKALLQNGLAKMETAYKALMQEYFG